MLTPDKSYSAYELQQMLETTKETEEGRDLALKDATHIYHNGPVSGDHVRRAAGNLARLRAINGTSIPLHVEDTALIPRGAMLYFAAGKLFAVGIEANELPA